MSPSEIIQQMPEYFLPQQAGNLNATYVFDLSGSEGGSFWVTIANSQVTTGTGTAPQPATVTFTMTDQTFVAIMTGVTNPVMAYMQGSVKIAGDLGIASRLSTLFRRP